MNRDGEPALTIVMPAHNEADLLARAVNEVLDGAPAGADEFELLVIENGSTDDTRTIAERLAVELPAVATSSMPDADYGAALRAGVLAARGDAIATFDVDYVDLGFLAEALALLRSAAATPPALVVGSKRAPGANDTRAFPRRLVTGVFSTILRIVFGLHVSDTHGMKVMARRPIQPLARQCRFDADLFDTELVLRVERSGLGTAELPVTVEERRPSRTPIWRRVPRTVLGLLRLRVALWQEHRR